MTAKGIIEDVLKGEQMISEKLHEKVYYALGRVERM